MKELCAEVAVKRLTRDGVATWNEQHNKLKEGRNIQTYVDVIERCVEQTEGFHPHVANQIFTQVLDDWRLGHLWTVPNTRTASKLWKFTIFFNRMVNGRKRKYNFLQHEKSIFTIEYLVF